MLVCDLVILWVIISKQQYSIPPDLSAHLLLAYRNIVFPLKAQTVTPTADSKLIAHNR